MIIVHPDSQAGSSGKRGSKFTGQVNSYLTMPPTDGVVINTVSFTPGARTYWHNHERGQILLVIAGKGLVQSEGEPVEVLRQGDAVWVPAGEQHWHGATPDSFMTHVAISLGTTGWADAVSDADYTNTGEAGE